MIPFSDVSQDGNLSTKATVSQLPHMTLPIFFSALYDHTRVASSLIYPNIEEVNLGSCAKVPAAIM